MLIIGTLPKSPIFKTNEVQIIGIMLIADRTYEMWLWVFGHWYGTRNSTSSAQYCSQSSEWTVAIRITSTPRPAADWTALRSAQSSTQREVSGICRPIVQLFDCLRGQPRVRHVGRTRQLSGRGGAGRFEQHFQTVSAAASARPFGVYKAENLR